MSALGKVVRTGVARRRLQMVVIGLVVLAAVSASVLGGTLLVASHAPFDRAFAQQNGAHLTALFDAGKVAAAQLRASAHAPGVTAAAGPFATASIDPVDEHDQPVSPITVAGRADPGGAVDTVTLTKGRWATGPGELVIYSDGRFRGNDRTVGRVWRMTDLPGSPTLTVVGVARSISETADGWVAPAEIATLTPPGAPGSYQMLYRFASAATAPQVETGRAAVEAAAPAGALTASRSWLTTRQNSAGNTELFVPILIAFGVLGLAMAVLIVGNVIAGAVGTGTRRIGLLKAVGFTPHQVVRAHVAQALIPALAGVALGLVAGNALALTMLAETNDIYGTGDSGVAPGVDAAVAAGVLALVALTAWAASSRTGRLPTVAALAVGRTPAPRRGRRAARLAARLPLRRPVTLGLAHPFARPSRSASIVAAVASGIAAVTFAVGLASSLAAIQASDGHQDVLVLGGRVTANPDHDGGTKSTVRAGESTTMDAAAVVRAVTAQTGTAGYCGVATTEVTAAGLTGALETLATTGDHCADGYRMVAGTWYHRAGEIVVATPFLTATHTRIGDRVVLTDHGTQVTARIVGEVFNTENDGRQILTPATTLTAAEPGLQPDQYGIVVKPGTDPAAYAAALDPALASARAHASVADTSAPEIVVVITALTTLLTLLLMIVAALGVLNTVVLETRERVHDLGVHKALGMAPGQTVAMVIASVVVTGVLGGLLGTPIGVLLQRLTVTGIGRTSGFTLPASVIEVYGPAQLIVLGLGGLVIAVLGALLPAGWAARIRTATALRAE